MQPSRLRLVCRAHNRFSPSTILRQHFLSFDRLVPHHERYSSSISDTAQGRGEETYTESSAAPKHNVSEQSHAQPQTTRPPKVVIRKTYLKEAIAHPDGRVSKSIHQGKHARDLHLAQIQNVLESTKRLCSRNGDYDATLLEPEWDKPYINDKRLPWTIPLKERPTDPMDRLNLEIQRFCDHIKPDRNEIIARERVIERVRDFVLKRHNNYDIEVYGSEKTGLALALSDIDFRIALKPSAPVNLSSEPLEPTSPQMPPPKREKRTLLNVLNGIRNHMKNERQYIDPKVYQSRYPLVNVTDKRSGLQVQIVSANDTSMSEGCIKKYLAEYPYLGQVYSVVKTMFDVRGLSDVFRGGVGSYPLFMMIVASIKLSPPERNDAAGALVNFLRFWRDFDTTPHGISIDPLELYDKSEEKVMTNTVRQKIKVGKSKPLPPFMLSLRDPADRENDLGRKGIAIKHVQKTMEHLLARLSADTSCNVRDNLSTSLVGPSFALNEHRRQKIRAYGRSLLRKRQTALTEAPKAVSEAGSTGVSITSDVGDVKPEAIESVTSQSSADATPQVVEEVAPEVAVEDVTPRAEDTTQGLSGVDNKTKVV